MTPRLSQIAADLRSVALELGQEGVALMGVAHVLQGCVGIVNAERMRLVAPEAPIDLKLKDALTGGAR